MPGSLKQEPDQIDGLRWHPNGQSVLSGRLLDLYDRLDALFLSWAARWSAREYSFPPSLPASELNKLDYFRSFPQLVTFPVSLAPDDENLERFTAQEPVTADGCLRLTETQQISEVLTPAACYHFYVNMQGAEFDQAQYVTTCATCFRREADYVPLQRQWNFSMREIVCIGTAEEVKEFLVQFRKLLEEFFAEALLPVSFEHATDPFFRPADNPKYVMQKLDPVKTELVFDGRLAVGSLNYHLSFFGETFSLTRAGQPLSSACVAFGIERWIYALLTAFPDADGEYPFL